MELMNCRLKRTRAELNSAGLLFHAMHLTAITENFERLNAIRERLVSSYPAKFERNRSTPVRVSKTRDPLP